MSRSTIAAIETSSFAAPRRCLRIFNPDNPGSSDRGSNSRFDQDDVGLEIGHRRITRCQKAMSVQQSTSGVAHSFVIIKIQTLRELATTIVDVAAAIANAVYHATGVRVRDLPIRLEKILVRAELSPRPAAPGTSRGSLRRSRTARRVARECEPGRLRKF